MSWKENTILSAKKIRQKKQKKTDSLICVAFSHQFLITAKNERTNTFLCCCCWLLGIACCNEVLVFEAFHEYSALACVGVLFFYSVRDNELRIYYAFRISPLLFSRRSFFLSRAVSSLFFKWTRDCVYMHVQTQTHQWTLHMSVKKKKQEEKKLHDFQII